MPYIKQILSSSTFGVEFLNSKIHVVWEIIPGDVNRI